MKGKEKIYNIQKMKHVNYYSSIYGGGIK